MSLQGLILHASPPLPKPNANVYDATSSFSLLPRRKLAFCVRSKQQKSSSEGDGYDGGRGDGSTSSASVAELKVALGIENKASSKPRASKPRSEDSESVLGSLERRSLAQESEYEESPISGKLQQVGDWLIEKMEGDGSGRNQERGIEFLLALFPLWLFCLLVAAGLIKLPFNLPFLEN